jgi:hypothetical protein
VPTLDTILDVPLVDDKRRWRVSVARMMEWRVKNRRATKALFLDFPRFCKMSIHED